MSNAGPQDTALDIACGAGWSSIALARAYFNDIASFYNARLQVVPDRFVAALGGLQPQPLMAANDFERAPMPVKFTI